MSLIVLKKYLVLYFYVVCYWNRMLGGIYKYLDVGYKWILC